MILADGAEHCTSFHVSPVPRGTPIWCINIDNPPLNLKTCQDHVDPTQVIVMSYVTSQVGLNFWSRTDRKFAHLSNFRTVLHQTIVFRSKFGPLFEEPVYGPHLDWGGRLWAPICAPAQKHISFLFSLLWVWGGWSSVDAQSWIVCPT